MDVGPTHPTSDRSDGRRSKSPMTFQEWMSQTVAFRLCPVEDRNSNDFWDLAD